MMASDHPSTSSVDGRAVSSSNNMASHPARGMPAVYPSSNSLSPRLPAMPSAPAAAASHSKNRYSHHYGNSTSSNGGGNRSSVYNYNNYEGGQGAAEARHERYGHTYPAAARNALHLVNQGQRLPSPIPPPPGKKQKSRGPIGKLKGMFRGGKKDKRSDSPNGHDRQTQSFGSVREPRSYGQGAMVPLRNAQVVNQVRPSRDTNGYSNRPRTMEPYNHPPSTPSPLSPDASYSSAYSPAQQSFSDSNPGSPEAAKSHAQRQRQQNLPGLPPTFEQGGEGLPVPSDMAAQRTPSPRQQPQMPYSQQQIQQQQIQQIEVDPEDDEEPCLSHSEIKIILQNHERYVVMLPHQPGPTPEKQSSSSKGERAPTPKLIQHKNKRSRLVSELFFNTLESNDPIEDHCCIHSWRNHLMVGVFDGHGGPECSRMVSRVLSRYVVTAMHKAHKGFRGNMYRASGRLSDPYLRAMTRAISAAFSRLDEDISMIPQLIFPRLGDDIYEQSETASKGILSSATESDPGPRKVPRGRTLKTIFSPSQIRHLLKPAMTGSVAVFAMLDEVHSVLYVANSGDSRSVLGHKRSDGRWQAVAMSTDHHPRNEDELRRLLAQHPGEEQTIAAPHPIAGGLRLLGGLAPSRAFGDNVYKWSAKRQRTILSKFFQNSTHSCEKTPPNYFTPPYLTAKPEVRVRQMQKGDRFMVLASDGLWDELSNEEVVYLVAEFLERRKKKCQGREGGGKRSRAPTAEGLQMPSRSNSTERIAANGQLQMSSRSSSQERLAGNGQLQMSSRSGSQDRLATNGQSHMNSRSSSRERMTANGQMNGMPGDLNDGRSERRERTHDTGVDSGVVVASDDSSQSKTRNEANPSASSSGRNSPVDEARIKRRQEQTLMPSGPDPVLEERRAKEKKGASSRGLWLEEEEKTEADFVDMEGIAASERFVFEDDNIATHLIRNVVGGTNQALVAESLACCYPECRDYRDDITVFVLVFRSDDYEAPMEEIIQCKLAERRQPGKLGHPSSIAQNTQPPKRRNAWIGPVSNAGKPGMHVSALDDSEDESETDYVPCPGYHAVKSPGMDLAKASMVIHPPPKGTEFDLVNWSDVVAGKVNTVEHFISGKVKLSAI